MTAGWVQRNPVIANKILDVARKIGRKERWVHRNTVLLALNEQENLGLKYGGRHGLHLVDGETAQGWKKKITMALNQNKQEFRHHTSGRAGTDTTWEYVGVVEA